MVGSPRERHVHVALRQKVVERRDVGEQAAAHPPARVEARVSRPAGGVDAPLEGLQIATAKRTAAPTRRARAPAKLMMQRLAPSLACAAVACSAVAADCCFCFVPAGFTATDVFVARSVASASASAAAIAAAVASASAFVFAAFASVIGAFVVSSLAASLDSSLWLRKTFGIVTVAQLLLARTSSSCKVRGG